MASAERFWDAAEAMPRGELAALQVQRLRACVERLKGAGNPFFPLLRYRTRDRTRLEREACACGRTSARLARILGRTDDMLIVRGVNVFPSQIEHALVGVPGLVPQYQIVLGTRADRQDDLRVRVETVAEPQEPAELAALEARVRETLHSALGLSVLVELLPPRTIQRSDGKTVRVVDQRAKG